jgi:hypothetical protein
MSWLVVVALGCSWPRACTILLLLRRGWFGGASVGLTPHAMFLLVCLLAALVVQRYSRSGAGTAATSTTRSPSASPHARASCARGFEALRSQQQDQAVLNERQRIMREIHDGVGSQLVAFQHAGPEKVDRPALEREIRLALDEMRLRSTRWQPMDSDLTVLLATLRYRLQPRFEAAGLEVAWEVEDLSPHRGSLAALDPAAAAHPARSLHQRAEARARQARAAARRAGQDTGATARRACACPTTASAAGARHGSRDPRQGPAEHARPRRGHRGDASDRVGGMRWHVRRRRVAGRAQRRRTPTRPCRPLKAAEHGTAPRYRGWPAGAAPQRGAARRPCRPVAIESLSAQGRRRRTSAHLVLA